MANLKIRVPVMSKECWVKPDDCSENRSPFGWLILAKRVYSKRREFIISWHAKLASSLLTARDLSQLQNSMPHK